MTRKIGQGTAFTWKGTDVGYGTVLRGPSHKVALKESTNFDSSGWEEFIADVKVGGTIHWECQLDGAASSSNAGQWAIINDDGTSGAWTLTFATGFTFSGTGYVSYETTTGPRDIEMLSVDIQITGTVTPASPT